MVASGQGATRLRQDPAESLLLCELIFATRDDDICESFLANNGHHPLDLLVLESYSEDRETPDETKEAPNKKEPFFDREVWDDTPGAEYARREMQEVEGWIEEDECLKADPEGGTPGQSGAGAIIGADRDVCIETHEEHRS